MTNSIYSHSLENGVFRVYSERPDFKFNEVKQVHGTTCSYPTTDVVEADALIQDSSDPTPMLIKTADCLPIIFEGHQENIILHAGWKGLALGILEIDEIRKIKPTSCFIGPAIHACCFEVSSDFKSAFPEVVIMNKNGKTYADLIEFTKIKILSLYPSIHIQESKICTMCDNQFHSYRRNKTQNRNYNVYFSKDDQWTQKNH